MTNRLTTLFQTSFPNGTGIWPGYEAETREFAEALNAQEPSLYMDVEGNRLLKVNGPQGPRYFLSNGVADALNQVHFFEITPSGKEDESGSLALHSPFLGGLVLYGGDSLIIKAADTQEVLTDSLTPLPSDGLTYLLMGASFFTLSQAPASVTKSNPTPAPAESFPSANTILSHLTGGQPTDVINDIFKTAKASRETILNGGIRQGIGQYLLNKIQEGRFSDVKEFLQAAEKKWGKSAEAQSPWNPALKRNDECHFLMGQILGPAIERLAEATAQSLDLPSRIFLLGAATQAYRRARNHWKAVDTGRLLVEALKQSKAPALILGMALTNLADDKLHQRDVRGDGYRAAEFYEEAARVFENGNRPFLAAQAYRAAVHAYEWELLPSWNSLNPNQDRPRDLSLPSIYSDPARLKELITKAAQKAELMSQIYENETRPQPAPLSTRQTPAPEFAIELISQANALIQERETDEAAALLQKAASEFASQARHAAASGDFKNWYVNLASQAETQRRLIEILPRAWTLETGGTEGLIKQFRPAYSRFLIAAEAESEGQLKAEMGLPEEAANRFASAGELLATDVHELRKAGHLILAQGLFRRMLGNMETSLQWALESDFVKLYFTSRGAVLAEDQVPEVETALANLQVSYVEQMDRILLWNDVLDQLGQVAPKQLRRAREGKPLQLTASEAFSILHHFEVQNGVTIPANRFLRESTSIPGIVNLLHDFEIRSRYTLGDENAPAVIAYGAAGQSLRQSIGMAMQAKGQSELNASDVLSHLREIAPAQKKELKKFGPLFRDLEKLIKTRQEDAAQTEPNVLPLVTHAAPAATEPTESSGELAEIAVLEPLANHSVPEESAAFTAEIKPKIQKPTEDDVLWWITSTRSFAYHDFAQDIAEGKITLSAEDWNRLIEACHQDDESVLEEMAGFDKGPAVSGIRRSFTAPQQPFGSPLTRNPLKGNKA